MYFQSENTTHNSSISFDEWSVKDKGQSCCTYMNMCDISQEWEATIYRNKPCDVQHLEIK